MVKRLTKGAAIFVLVLFLVSNSVTMITYSSAKTTSEAYIDQTLFRATIPSIMTLGKSCRVQVLVVNNSTQYLSGFVLLDYSSSYFYTVQPKQVFQLSPGESQDFYYLFVASNPHDGGLNVSAVLFINNGTTPVREQTVSVTVLTIIYSPWVKDIPVYLIAGALAVGIVYAFTLIRKRSRARKNPPILSGTSLQIHYENGLSVHSD
jgi:hypothetical protein